MSREAEAITGPDANADPNASFDAQDLDGLRLRARNIADLYERELDQLYARMEPLNYYGKFLGSEKKSPKKSPKSEGRGKDQGRGRGDDGGGSSPYPKGSTTDKGKMADIGGAGGQLHAADFGKPVENEGIPNPPPLESPPKHRYQSQGGSPGGQSSQRTSPKSKDSTGLTSPNKKAKGRHPQQDADNQIELTDIKRQ